MAGGATATEQGAATTRRGTATAGGGDAARGSDTGARGHSSGRGVEGGGEGGGVDSSARQRRGESDGTARVSAPKQAVTAMATGIGIRPPTGNDKFGGA